MLLRKQLFKHLFGLNVAWAFRRTVKRDLYESVAIPELQAVFDIEVVMSGNMNLPALLLQCFHMRQMKLADMAQYGCGVEDLHSQL